ncbi:MAG: hypothetical protein AAF610_13550 [Pseudomonadota bacterium]
MSSLSRACLPTRFGDTGVTSAARTHLESGMRGATGAMGAAGANEAMGATSVFSTP